MRVERGRLQSRAGVEQGRRHTLRTAGFGGGDLDLVAADGGRRDRPATSSIRQLGWPEPWRRARFGGEGGGIRGALGARLVGSALNRL